MFSRIGFFSRRLIEAWTYCVKAKKFFALPKPAPILVLDDGNHNLLVPLFRGTPYTLVNLTGKEICCALPIILDTVWNFFQCRRLKVAYALAMLRRIKPSIVVTYIDSNGVFQQVARITQSVRFLAVQNGNRLLERDNPPGSQQIYLKEFACLGKYEIDLYTRHGAIVERFYPVGMLLDSYYRKTNPIPPRDKDFDICVVSGVQPDLAERHTERMDSFIRLVQYVERFCNTHKKSVCVAMRRHPEQNAKLYDWELTWYQQYLGNVVKLYPNTPGAFNTYDLTDRSKVSLGMHSTAMREAFGRGNRILSCNFSGNPVYDFPVAGPWALDTPDYEVFEARLIYLLELNDADYRECSAEAVDYLTGYSSDMPPHEFLANIISDAVKEIFHM